MKPGWVKRTYLRVLARTINPLALAAARSGRGPFALLRHTGRRSGRTYETPLILARVAGGFVAELTYGADVAWCRNLAANGRGEVLVGGALYRVTGLEPYSTAAGMDAYPQPQRTILKLLRRSEFRLITIAGDRT
ncbi:nitroreductase family deazaflavin-dependent oxidoreductase [Mycobacterium hodleri]|uniref:nitroreductase/quinone reductase family protein n=1 Tax=Mycolicibacterium hodleri TaxID=49897 RepID=UPI0021F3A593|nr:nitroreductase/quinone reductase family protein [Mycolicibacterium hodleri]MCV7133988.1 nitroreductase family deazaflavin-dependent oxidoreductase [Mycolicibacterium hodleri]